MLAPCFRKFLAPQALEYRDPRREARRSRVSPRFGKRKAATGAFGLSPSAQRPTRNLRAGLRLLARPAEPCRLFTGARRAACCPSTSAIEWTREHTLRTLRTRWDVLAKRQPTGNASLRRDGQPGCLESGVARQFLAVSTPALRPLAARIYPDSLRSEHPHVARLTPLPAGNPLATAIYGSDPSEEDQLALANQAEAWPRPRPWLAFRAAVPPGHANGSTVNCTQGAFRLPILAAARAKRAFCEGWWLSRAGFPGIGRPSHTTPFSPARPQP